MRKKIEHQTFEEERALYHLKNADVIECTFAGLADGESVLKEASDIIVKDCTFSLRYPLWLVKTFCLISSNMDEKTRAPIWYTKDGKIKDCTIEGIKCLRECTNINIKRCDIKSPEFGWKCKNIDIFNSQIESEYFLFESEDIKVKELLMKGKYSFQYVKNVLIEESTLDTKDAFWHSQNVTVKNCIVKGEYLGWFSEGLTLINCKIIGTQPLCYCKNLKLVNCIMESTDLSFEYSEVNAEIKGNIISVKNPKSGTIIADSIGEIIKEDSVMETEAVILQRHN